MPSVPSSHQYRYRPCLESLEAREAAAGLQPTAVEQLFLERLNDVRANPAAYGIRAPAVQPLAFDPRVKPLTRFFSFRNLFFPGTVDGVKARLRATGVRFSEPNSITLLVNSFITSDFPGFDLGEHVASQAVSLAQPQRGESALLSLWSRANVRLRPHRVIGFSLNAATQSARFITLAPADQAPRLTGAVFRDADADGKYDLGEGLAGVTIQVAGQKPVRAFDAGGFTVTLKRPGVHTVTLTGGGLSEPVTHTVRVAAGKNVRLRVAV